MTESPTHRAIEAIFRIERARLIGSLARVVRNVDRAEELAQDALVVALSEWPEVGVPANPGAWLITAARRRAIDALRRDKMRARKHEQIARETLRCATTRRCRRRGATSCSDAADWPRPVPNSRLRPGSPAMSANGPFSLLARTPVTDAAGPGI